MNCKFCGTQIFESDRTCVRCGAPFDMDDFDVPPPPTYYYNPTHMVTSASTICAPSFDRMSLFMQDNDYKIYKKAMGYK